MHWHKTSFFSFPDVNRQTVHGHLREIYVRVRGTVILRRRVGWQPPIFSTCVTVIWSSHCTTHNARQLMTISDLIYATIWSSCSCARKVWIAATDRALHMATELPPPLPVMRCAHSKYSRSIVGSSATLTGLQINLCIKGEHSA